jgi:DNA gyrase/topoisomerase IV subunit A
MRCSAADIRVYGRAAKGVRLMALQASDEVQSLAVMPAVFKTALA